MEAADRCKQHQLQQRAGAGDQSDDLPAAFHRGGRLNGMEWNGME
jgi:hypothetical protein